jgi:uncharacterized short protein YbdD (DUF466 family)
MICPCWPSRAGLSAWRRRASETARLMLGVPDYDAYVAHLATAHPGVAPLDRDAFFIERQAARYGGGGLRCC